MPTENGNQPANLAAARKEQAAARKAARAVHPADKEIKKTPAKKVAEKAPRKASARSDKPPLRWKKQDGGGLVATTDEAVYSIVKSGDKFKALVKKDGKTTTVLDGVSDGRCYSALTRLYHYGEIPQAKKASA